MLSAIRCCSDGVGRTGDRREGTKKVSRWGTPSIKYNCVDFAERVVPS